MKSVIQATMFAEVGGAHLRGAQPDGALMSRDAQVSDAAVAVGPPAATSAMTESKVPAVTPALFPSKEHEATFKQWLDNWLSKVPQDLTQRRKNAQAWLDAKCERPRTEFQDFISFVEQCFCPDISADKMKPGQCSAKMKLDFFEALLQAYYVKTGVWPLGCQLVVPDIFDIATISSTQTGGDLLSVGTKCGVPLADLVLTYFKVWCESGHAIEVVDIETALDKCFRPDTITPLPGILRSPRDPTVNAKLNQYLMSGKKKASEAKPTLTFD
jgi:hypothetical protein